MVRLNRLGILASLTCCLVANAADHRDAPSILSDGRTDINDVYIFRSPADSKNTVIVVTVNPVAGVLSPTTFHPKADYIVRVDTDGDAKENYSLITRFSTPNSNGVQKVALFGQPPAGRGPSAKLAEGLTGQTINIKDGGKIRAGIFDDPFLFDLDGFKNNLQFTGTNFFAGLNVTAIVIELPTKQLLAARPPSDSNRPSNTRLDIWAITRLDGKQLDRMGRPAINTVLIDTDLKDDFNEGLPRNDREDFRETVIDHLKDLGNNTTRARSLANVLLPDILTFDTAVNSGFLNGRRLKDDVIDIELNLLSNGAVKGDGVANDSSFRSSFPYLAVPNR